MDDSPAKASAVQSSGYGDRATWPHVTIASPLLNEAPRFPVLLASLLALDYSRRRLQILLIDGGSTDGTAELAARAAADYRHIEFIRNQRTSAAAALNLAIERARGDFLLRLDARSRPEPDYVANAVRRLQEQRWAGVAGPQKAVGMTPAGRVYALVLNHPLGTGAPRYRRTSNAAESETLYLGAYPLDWLRQIGGWDEGFLANEDYELNCRLRAAGGRLLVDPDIRTAYVVRDSLRALARQYARYGAWRTVTWRRHPDAMRLRHIAPALFAVALSISLLLVWWSAWPLALVIALYAIPILVASLQLSLKHGLRTLPRLLVTFPTLHLSWGFAYWLALLQPPGHQGGTTKRR